LFYGILYGQLILKNQHRKYLNFCIKTDLLSVYIKYIVLYLEKNKVHSIIHYTNIHQTLVILLFKNGYPSKHAFMSMISR